MHSIRSYEGEVRICTSCGQPAGQDVDAEIPGMWAHFTEQWDGIHCPHFPLASTLIAINWDVQSLEDLRKQYPDTYPH